MKKLVLYFLLLASLLLCFSASSAHARTEGYYIGAGYQQPLIITWKNQLMNQNKRISFWPGFGGFVKVGYEFERPDWIGLALPINWSMLKLNKTEWVQLFNADAEVLFHLREPEKKFDVYLAALAGFNFLTEGRIQDQSQSLGPDVGAAFGFNYTLMEYALAGSPKVTNLSLSVEVPVKFMMFINDGDLASSNFTPFINIPVRVGLQYSF